MRKTRKRRARELLDLARRGPAFSAGLRRDFDAAAARRAYRIWSTTWLLPEIQRLVPELRGTTIELVTEAPIDTPAVAES